MGHIWFTTYLLNNSSYTRVPIFNIVMLFWDGDGPVLPGYERPKSRNANIVIIQIIHENSIHIIIIPHKLTNMDKINNISVYEA